MIKQRKRDVVAKNISRWFTFLFSSLVVGFFMIMPSVCWMLFGSVFFKRGKGGVFWLV